MLVSVVLHFAALNDQTLPYSYHIPWAKTRIFRICLNLQSQYTIKEKVSKIFSYLSRTGCISVGFSSLWTWNHYLVWLTKKSFFYLICWNNFNNFIFINSFILRMINIHETFFSTLFSLQLMIYCKVNWIISKLLVPIRNLHQKKMPIGLNSSTLMVMLRWIRRLLSFIQRYNNIR